MVDAAIGGKNSINSEYGKNLIGTTYFPKQTLICVEFLKTLSQKLFNNGMAEVIKVAAL